MAVGVDAVSGLPLSIEGPDPDGAGPLPRPTTRYRYDERAVGTASTAGPDLVGLRASYFTNSELAGIATRTQTEPASQDGAAIDRNWGTGGPPALSGQADYSVRWSGKLPSLDAGQYDFKVTADDRVRLLIDGQPVIDDWRDSPVRALTGTRTLSGGDHRIDLRTATTRTQTARASRKHRRAAQPHPPRRSPTTPPRRRASTS